MNQADEQRTLGEEPQAQGDPWLHTDRLHVSLHKSSPSLGPSDALCQAELSCITHSYVTVAPFACSSFSIIFLNKYIQKETLYPYHNF